MGNDDRASILVQEDEDDAYDHDISDHNSSSLTRNGADTYYDNYDYDEVAAGAPLSATNVPSITAAILAAGTTGGTTYAFGLYAGALKHSLHLSQSELDTISSAFFCAGLLSWAPGIVVDKSGPKFAMMLGGLLGAISLICYWVVSMGYVPVPRSLVVATLSLLGIATYVSSALVTGSVFKLIVQFSGKGQRGTAVGAAKGYVGLGSGAYACIFEAIRGPHNSDHEEGDPSDLNFLPMAAFFAVMAVTVPAMCLLEAKTSTTASQSKIVATTSTHFRVVYLGLLGLGAVVVGTSVLELFGSESSSNQQHNTGNRGLDVLKAIFIVFMWFGPISTMLCLPRKSQNDNNRGEEAAEEENDLRPPSGLVACDDNTIDNTNNSSSNNNEEHVEMEKLFADEAVTATEEEEDQEEGLLSSEDGRSLNASNKINRHQHQRNEVESLTLTQMLRTVPAWLLLWTGTILAGGGTVMTNNIGQMVESLGLHPTTAPAALALFSAAQSAGRVLTGSISEWALSGKMSLPRPAFLVIASFGGCAAHFLLGMATSEVSFVVGVALSGAAFGMIWPLLVLIVGECFGADHVGANYMFYDGVTSAIGTLVLSKFVAQAVYESHIEEAGGTWDNEESTPSGKSDGLTCYGEKCFQASHFIVAGLSMTCVVSSVALMFKTRHVYENK